MGIRLLDPFTVGLLSKVGDGQSRFSHLTLTISSCKVRFSTLRARCATAPGSALTPAFSMDQRSGTICCLYAVSRDFHEVLRARARDRCAVRDGA